MKEGIDALRGFRYKLRMMGIPISSPLYIYRDIMSVLHNTSRQESVLRKKSNSVCYHTVHELVAMGESLVHQIHSKENVADLMTKVLYGQKRKYLVSYQLSQERLQSDKPDPIENSIKLELIRKMWL